jgi:hypothetical protein
MISGTFVRQREDSLRVATPDVRYTTGNAGKTPRDALGHTIRANLNRPRPLTLFPAFESQFTQGNLRQLPSMQSMLQIHEAGRIPASVDQG